jgi:hypothetical protein
MPSDSVETLQKINSRLREALTRLRPEHRRCSTLIPEDFSAILKDLLRAAECLQKLSSTLEPGASCPVTSNAPSLQEEARAYRSNLNKLNQFLPDLHARLLAEKSRLGQALTHAAAAGSWAQANKTLL